MYLSVFERIEFDSVPILARIAYIAMGQNTLTMILAKMRTESQLISCGSVS